MRLYFIRHGRQNSPLCNVNVPLGLSATKKVSDGVVILNTLTREPRYEATFSILYSEYSLILLT